MGYMRHNAIIVTSSSADYRRDPKHWADFAHAKAVEIFEGIAPVTPVVDGVVNDVRSFMIGPDGSKEGWFESDWADEDRKIFQQWLWSVAYEDGSSPLQWVEVQYGDERGNTLVIADSDMKYRASEFE